MNEAQRRLEELRQELETNSRLRHLIAAIAKDCADAELRHLYKTNDAAVLIRGTGIAEGMEKLASHLTATRPAKRSRNGTAADDLL